MLEGELHYHGGMEMALPVHIPMEELTRLCRAYHVRRLAFFGSVLRDDFGPNSDVDMLIEFEPGQTPGLAFFRLQSELSELFGREVDLNTEKCLSPQFRLDIEHDARNVYVAA
jgi:predicted nucleotidyltransferase